MISVGVLNFIFMCVRTRDYTVCKNCTFIENKMSSCPGCKNEPNLGVNIPLRESHQCYYNVNLNFHISREKINKFLFSRNFNPFCSCC